MSLLQQAKEAKLRKDEKYKEIQTNRINKLIEKITESLVNGGSASADIHEGLTEHSINKIISYFENLGFNVKRRVYPGCEYSSSSDTLIINTKKKAINNLSNLWGLFE